MIAYLNGCARSGTHALQKAVELLGLPVYKNIVEMRREGYNYCEHDENVKEIFIHRHPKNRMISRLRRIHNFNPSEGQIISGTYFEYDEQIQFLPFLSDPNCLIITLEDLIKDDQCLRSIASWLNVAYLEDAFPNLPGMTYSWHPVPSKWEDYWTPAINDAWIANRGTELEQAFGWIGQ